jgi:hypothetical protein
MKKKLQVLVLATVAASFALAPQDAHAISIAGILQQAGVGPQFRTAFRNAYLAGLARVPATAQPLYNTVFNFLRALFTTPLPGTPAPPPPVI